MASRAVRAAVAGKQAPRQLSPTPQTPTCPCGKLKRAACQLKGRRCGGEAVGPFSRFADMARRGTCALSDHPGERYDICALHRRRS
jgi:hypothetical protein